MIYTFQYLKGHVLVIMFKYRINFLILKYWHHFLNLVQESKFINYRKDAKMKSQQKILDFTGYNLYIDIDVHLNQWTVTIR